MRSQWTLRVNQHYHFIVQQAEAHQAFFPVVLPLVFSCDSEVIPNCITSFKIETVTFDVQAALGFVPCGIVNCIYKMSRAPDES